MLYVFINKYISWQEEIREAGLVHQILNCFKSELPVRLVIVYWLTSMGGLVLCILCPFLGTAILFVHVVQMQLHNSCLYHYEPLVVLPHVLFSSLHSILRY